MQQDIYMTTGEFARMMRVSKDTLFHYDKIGLLKPDIVMSRGSFLRISSRTTDTDTIPYTRPICWRPSSCCGTWACR